MLVNYTVPIDVYRWMLQSNYLTMPSYILEEYVKEYALMEHPGFPVITPNDKLKYSNTNETN